VPVAVTPLVPAPAPAPLPVDAVPLVPEDIEPVLEHPAMPAATRRGRYPKRFTTGTSPGHPRCTHTKASYVPSSGAVNQSCSRRPRRPGLQWPANPCRSGHLRGGVSRPVVGLLGPNGAGKTTTLKLMLGMLRPSAGSALILGLDCISHSRAVKERIGYCPDEPAFFDFLTGGETLDFPVSWIGTRRWLLAIGAAAGALAGVAAAAYGRLVERFDLDPGPLSNAYENAGSAGVSLGLLAGLLYELSGGILAGILAHAAYNAVVTLGASPDALQPARVDRFAVCNACKVSRPCAGPPRRQWAPELNSAGAAFGAVCG
jgi:hypothetical protein